MGKMLRLGKNRGNMETGKEHHRLLMCSTTDRQNFVPCRDLTYNDPHINSVYYQPSYYPALSTLCNRVPKPWLLFFKLEVGHLLPEPAS